MGEAGRETCQFVPLNALVSYGDLTMALRRYWKTESDPNLRRWNPWSPAGPRKGSVWRVLLSRIGKAGRLQIQKR